MSAAIGYRDGGTEADMGGTVDSGLSRKGVVGLFVFGRDGVKMLIGGLAIEGEVRDSESARTASTSIWAAARALASWRRRR